MIASNGPTASKSRAFISRAVNAPISELQRQRQRCRRPRNDEQSLHPLSDSDDDEFPSHSAPPAKKRKRSNGKSNDQPSFSLATFANGRPADQPAPVSANHILATIQRSAARMNHVIQPLALQPWDRVIG